MVYVLGFRITGLDFGVWDSGYDLGTCSASDVLTPARPVAGNKGAAATCTAEVERVGYRL